MKNDFVIVNNVVHRGVGKMFYQDGFPISMAIERFGKAGIEVSISGVIDELRENGWSDKTINNKLKADFQDSGNISELKKMLNE